MTASGLRGSEQGELHRQTMRRLARLMAGRLACSLGIFAAALAFEGTGRPISEGGERALDATLALAFLATALFAAAFRGVRRAERFAVVQVATDLSIVSALVHLSGGHHSIFSFLYLPVVAYAAVLFDSRRALVAACAATLAHGLVLALGASGWLPRPGGAPQAPGGVLIALWAVHGAALFLVAFLGGVLSRELERTGRALDRSAADLLRLRGLHERTVESLMSGLLTTDREHHITSFNPEAEHITGTPRERALGRDVEDVIPNVRSLFGEARGELPAARQRTRMAYRNALGEALYLGLASSPLRDADGTPTGYVLIFQDVTEVVAMEAELRRSERLAAVGKLAAHLAHEVRNPLAAISGSLQILQSCLATGEGDAERDRLMGIVLRETRRLDTLITDFLRYARPSEAKPERVALREFVDEFVEVFQASKPETVSLGVRVPEGLAAWVDAAQLRQVLWNLALNAVQAMPEGGALRLEARAVVPEPQEARAEGRNDLEAPGKGQVEISVSDSGSGMAPEVLDRILDPFFTTKSGGSGLGLATVHRIVEANHGTLRVESAPGRGSTFRIRLPAAGERA